MNKRSHLRKYIVYLSKMTHSNTSGSVSAAGKTIWGPPSPKDKKYITVNYPKYNGSLIDTFWLLHLLKELIQNYEKKCKILQIQEVKQSICLRKTFPQNQYLVSNLCEPECLFNKAINLIWNSGYKRKLKQIFIWFNVYWIDTSWQNHLYHIRFNSKLKQCCCSLYERSLFLIWCM